MLTRTLYRKIEDEDRTVELKITEFSWWTTVNILRTYFVDKMLPLIKNMGDDEDTQVLDLIQKFLTSADQDLVDRFTKEFLARVFYRIAGDVEWLPLAEDEEPDIETMLVAFKEVGEINLKAFSRAIAVMGYGKTMAALLAKLDDMKDTILETPEVIPSQEESD